MKAKPLPSAVIDYLHGDIESPEASEIACYYEYAREWHALGEAAKERDRRLADLKKAGRGRVDVPVLACAIAQRYRGFPFWAVLFLGCTSFPKVDWNGLSKNTRNGIAKLFKNPKSPLLMPDIWSLKAAGWLQKFEALASDSAPLVQDVPLGDPARPVKLTPALVHGHENCYFGVFEIDFSKTKNELCKDFAAWLDLPSQKEFLRTHQKAVIGTTGKTLDRLKDLAIWRLRREAGSCDAANAVAEAHRKERRHFHGQRHTKQEPASLGSEAFFLRAKRRAQQHLARITRGRASEQAYLI